MISREIAISNIRHRLAILADNVKMQSGLNIQSLNIYAENFYRDFLNLLYDYNLKNINIIEKNSAAIDLGDTTNRVAFQVTSTCSKKKIDSTIEKFLEHEYYKQYEQLKFIIITEKSEVKNTASTNGLFSFDPKKDILDKSDLLVKINDLTLERLQQVEEFISKNIPIETQNPVEKVSREVATIMTLIEFFSNEENIQIQEGEELPPDPAKKIYKRFADYSDFLIQRYAELSSIYSHSLSFASKAVGIDHVRAIKISSFLKITSDRFLREAENNPRTALDRLTDYFEEKITPKGQKLDQTAVQFYLIHQLIQCNVFPNESK